MIERTKDKRLKTFSVNLRKSMTEEERKLWYLFLSVIKGTKFRRQKVIGKYIVDFYCEKHKLVIEIDGTQHFYEKGQEKDKERDKFLKDLGLTVLRYSNNEINTQFESVCEDIYNYING